MSSRNPIGTPFIELLTVDSTNNYATALVHEGMAQHGTAVFAHEQTKGRGQYARPWLTGRGTNIAMSLVIDPHPLVSSQMFYLSMSIALATRSFFNKHAGSEVSIKWPNDLYWRDRKAGGILIENILQGSQWRYAIAGVGININQTDFGALGTRAVSLKQITGSQLSPIDAAKELCGLVDEELSLLAEDQHQAWERYNQQLYRLNEPTRLKKDNRVFDAVIREVTPQGVLVVQHATEERFEVGTVEWLA